MSGSAHNPMLRLGAVYSAEAAAEGLPSFARHIEQLGFGQLWVIEDCFLSGGMTLAASALAVSERIGVGVGLLPAPLRNPALMAMEISTLARLHPGRFTAAIGHGVRSWMQQAGALPPRRLQALEEVVSAVRALLAGDRVTVDGDYVSLRDVQLETTPAEVPDVLVGSTGPRGLDIGLRAADGVLLPEGCGAGFIEWALNSEHEHARRRCVVYVWLAIDDDADAAVARAAPALRKWARSDLYPWPRRFADLPPEPADLTDDQLADIADRVCIAGDPPACARAIERLLAAGADELILLPLGADAMVELERVATDVAALLAGA